MTLDPQYVADQIERAMETAFSAKECQALLDLAGSIGVKGLLSPWYEVERQSESGGDWHVVDDDLSTIEAARESVERNRQEDIEDAEAVAMMTPPSWRGGMTPGEHLMAVMQWAHACNEIVNGEAPSRPSPWPKYRIRQYRHVGRPRTVT